MTTDTNRILQDLASNTNLSRFKIEEIRVLMVKQNDLLKLHNEMLIETLNENNRVLEDLLLEIKNIATNLNDN